MKWRPMNNKELQALRKLFFLSVAEAAEHIGGVSARSWQFWESGKYSIPEDVADRMLKLAQRRLNMIETCEDLINENHEVEEITQQYYSSLESFAARYPAATMIDWRLAQSVAAYFCGEMICRIV